MDSLLVNEVFHSIQGESTWMGHPCVFVRLTGCNLRCDYCDTVYAFYEGHRRTVDEVVAQVEGFGCPLVEVTGGEPLLQPGARVLMGRLCQRDKTVLLETSGACDISPCDERVIRIVDLKTPGSGEAQRNLWSNIDHLTRRDEVKFVVCDREDYCWTREVITRYDLVQRVNAVLLSPAWPVMGDDQIAGVEGLALCDLAQWVLEDGLAVRVQTQLHKHIWDPALRGV